MLLKIEDLYRPIVTIVLSIAVFETGVAFANLSLFGRMPQRRESLISGERSGEKWVLRIFISNGTGYFRDFCYCPY